MTYPEFETRWKNSGGAERANYAGFLQDLCDLIGVTRPDPMTANPAEDAYVIERPVEFNDNGKRSTGRIDLYKRGCFVLETKQGTDTPDGQKAAERAELGLPTEKRRKGHAVRGSAKWQQMMQTARQQALGYVRALPADEPRPLFVLVADVGYCIDVYSNFAGVGDQFVPFPDQTRYRIPLARLADKETRELLRQIWTDPRELDPSRRAARVTRELAGYLANLSAQLERAGHAPDLVAQFLMRCLFTMFSEDVGLIPKESFTGMLRQYAQPDLRDFLPDALQTLWHTMDTGGFSPDLKARLRKFNGKLFHDARALPLSADQIALLQKAAEADWTAVEPAIFGTLLERALDPRERHSLGAHYTPRRYVERLVLPTVLEPLRREWAAAQAAAAQLLNEGKEKPARAELERFLRRLTSIKILDPACGSGNFLYVTLEHLKRLEGEVLAAINSYGVTALLNLSGGTTISPRQLLGLELNPRAAAIADVVLKIGYLQWHLRTHGMSELPSPLLDEYENIHQQDAVLQHGPPVARVDANGQPVTRWDGITTKLHPVTGQPVPDETARVTVNDYPNPRPAEWPQADYIVGNPPFVGNKYMRDALGDGYTEALRKTYKGKVPESADLVMYWWYKAAEHVKQGNTERFGLITTNSLKQTFNRRTMQPFLDGDKSTLVLTFAIPDHPWVEGTDGAAVRIAMTVVEPKSNVVINGNLLTVQSESVPVGDDAADVMFVARQGQILSDLTIGAALDSVYPLRSNKDISNNGVKLHGSGFIVTAEKATELGIGRIDGIEKYIKHYRNGKDLTDKPRNVLVVDLFGLSEQDVLQKYPTLYQHVYEFVKPEREHNERSSRKDKWWIFGEPNPKLRQMVASLPRYIATVVTAKHRVFQFLEESILPDDALAIIALNDAYYLGVLSSKIHVSWALAAGSDLGGNTPRYTKTRCFDPFPFPDAAPQQQARIRELAEQLDAHRKRQQAAHPTLTLTDLYNVVEKLKAGESLSTKEQTINQQGLASVVLSLHQQLDTAVSDAYGWLDNLPDSEILTRLVRLNHERAAEETAGHIRYLRPSYQAPGQQQLGIDLPTVTAPAVEVSSGPASRQEWPKELAQQMQAIRDAVQQAGVPINAKQIAAQFQRTNAGKVQPLLDTLATLALIRQTPEGAYAV
ncbi:class I SAM-dependent DNA methyltransferase [Spirosoma rhododendri]|uniref:site-specific DNA-methyltransferase (adenine-specific) n=1 Tax=Spirosoma rhododendri TaxID=2728024 RepID=A0A7L5DP76_9BACT|nr:class I SAM-dependent DNA methyltransferase [Spirosoma rhododendri]QJD77817.1 class I SAM-dependent DNA methyltransferase [Spirosoma rhododendri]